MKILSRVGLGLPLAGVVTIGLATAMAAMISTEFKAEEKLQTYAFEINPVIDDPVLPLAETELEPLKKVDVPPPPSSTGFDPADKVIEVPYLPKRVDTFTPTDSIKTTKLVLNTNSNPQPIVRVPPIMPSRAERSGYCDVRFNVSAEGTPYDILVTECTDSVFKRATLKSVAKWKYRPRYQEGQAISMTGLTNRVRFRLTDERGNIIPE